jgi:hypothetical protein
VVRRGFLIGSVRRRFTKSRWAAGPQRSASVGGLFLLQAAMTLVIISFDVYGSRGKEQSIIRHQRGSSPTNACFQGLFVHFPPRNGGVTPDLRPPCRYSRMVMRARSDGDVEDIW